MTLMGIFFQHRGKKSQNTEINYRCGVSAGLPRGYLDLSAKSKMHTYLRRLAIDLAVLSTPPTYLPRRPICVAILSTSPRGR